MYIAIYGNKNEYQELCALAKKQTALQYRQVICKYTENYDEWIELLSEKEVDAVFVLMGGANGMEGVIAARNVCPAVPVVWVSDDKGFGVQSYRLGCAFFSVMPLSERSVSVSFARILKKAEENRRYGIREESRFEGVDHVVIEKIKHAKDAEEMVATAKEHGVLIALEEAKNYFRFLSDYVSGELDDDALDGIAGGVTIDTFKLFFDSFNNIAIDES